MTRAGGEGARCDVLIIGGGPAGATCGALLAEMGFAVVLCEREKFPRFHVGESLLPRGNEILSRLGILERCRAMGWTQKLGASFLFEEAVGAFSPSFGSEATEEATVESTHGDDSRSPHEASFSAYSSIQFGEALGGEEPPALQVPRAEFDALLLARARELGVQVVEECQVRSTEFSDQGADVSIQRKGQPKREYLRARFVVDASGQAGFLAKRMRLRESDPALLNLACFAHFSGWQWPAAVQPGNIQVVSLADLRWVWVIPLASDRVSVGLVEPKGQVKDGSGRLANSSARLLAALSETRLLALQSRRASRQTEVHQLADFSYCPRSYSGDRWLLVGDAGAFIDPVFSTGVYLALNSGAEAAQAIQVRLRVGKRPGTRRLRRFAVCQRSRYAFYRRFVLKFYRPGMRDLLCQARNGLRLPRALSSVLAGEWRPSWRIRWRLEIFYLLAALQERVKLVERLHKRP